MCPKMEWEEDNLSEGKSASAPARKQQGQVPQELHRALIRTSWMPSDELELGDWVEQGRRLGVIGRTVNWWIGDWLRYGNMKFGQRYSRASRITGYDAQTLMNIVYVASAYKPSQRRGKLSFSHHAELAALPSDERESWLDLAERNRLSVRCLREELRRARRATALAGAADAGTLVELESEPAKRRAQKVTVDEHALRCPRCGCEIAESAPVPLLAAGRKSA